MELHLKPNYNGAKYTAGALYLGPYDYFCDTLEPPVGVGSRHRAIPPGRYTVVVARTGPHKRWLPRLVGMGGRKGICMNEGNTAGDTKGGILVGRGGVPGILFDSHDTLARLLRRLAHRPLGETVHLTVE